MEIHSAIIATPYSMPRSAGFTPSASAAASDAEFKRADGATGAAPVEEGEDEEEATQRTGASGSASDLSADELDELQRLKQRDTEVRTHEQAHVAVGGRYVTSGPTYDYQTGPDGVRYAIGGEVGIDSSKIPGDPAATVEKARTVRRAALAPAEPSSQDMSVAASASKMESEALRELGELMMQQSLGKFGGWDTGSTAAADETEQTEANRPTALGARERLEQRIAGFFAEPATGSLSQFA
ncbi:putative metalloprotease CJM1_0395 family protein [Thiobaca trueperi]|uniref:SprA family protein n=1 Tax=Thiobaca trueperi TaxID=127458 RepID=A0A4R3NAD1_9GAMM|nr:putative metalloprotease CJM1_0395 family protein [Thiobaca trueperi]TCT24123.1 SprA family protein [Thiobaca trueperi]